MQVIEAQVAAPLPRKRRWLLWTIIPFIVATASLSYFAEELGIGRLLDGISYLKVTELSIQTDAPLTEADITAWLPPVVGRNLLTLPVRRIAENLEQKPWVADVAVRKEFPHRLFIVVHTKTPQAVYRLDRQYFFLDAAGSIIDRASLGKYDVPLISWNPGSSRDLWMLGRVVEFTKKFRDIVDNGREVSQVVLGTFPSFRVFLVSPKWEVWMTFTQWPEQMETLNRLLKYPPRPAATIKAVNLTIPKKAVVSYHDSN